MKPSARTAWLVVVSFVIACRDDAVPLEPAVARALDAPAIADIGGRWVWSETTLLQFPSFVAQEVFGIEPEGLITHATCESGGTVTLSQSAYTFAGALSQTGTCTSTGGQSFEIPWPSVSIQGTVAGHAFTADLDVSCAMSGSIMVENGIAVAMTGTGGCRVPTMGVNRSLHWKATRP